MSTKAIGLHILAVQIGQPKKLVDVKNMLSPKKPSLTARSFSVALTKTSQRGQVPGFQILS
jgi:hypothetical protein